MDIIIRKATESDIEQIVSFTDYWMRGYGAKYKIPGTGNDYFVPRRQHLHYIRKHSVRIAFYSDVVVGWAVLTNKRVLIHLLVTPTLRGQGIGSALVDECNPIRIRSKTDQKAGNPIGFYKRLGFIPQSNKLEGRKHNIQVLIKEE